MSGGLSIIQILLITAWAFWSIVDSLSWNIGFNNCILACLFTGVVVGDMKYGLIVGGTLQMTQLGAGTYGGASIPNITSSGMIATALGAASGADLLLFCGGAAADDVRAAPGVSGAEPAGCAGLLRAAARLAQPVADARPARAVSGADGGAQCAVQPRGRDDAVLSAQRQPRHARGPVLRRGCGGDVRGRDPVVSVLQRRHDGG